MREPNPAEYVNTTKEYLSIAALPAAYGIFALVVVNTLGFAASILSGGEVGLSTLPSPIVIEAIAAIAMVWVGASLLGAIIAYYARGDEQ